MPENLHTMRNIMYRFKASSCLNGLLAEWFTICEPYQTPTIRNVCGDDINVIRGKTTSYS